MPNGVQTPSDEQPPDPLDDPELLLINALLDDPAGFRPDLYGVGKEMFDGWSKPFQFCLDHQSHTGRPPGRELFARTFPDFEQLRNLDSSWAAQKVREAYQARSLRRAMRESIELVNGGDVDAAKDRLQRLLTRPSAATRPRGVSIFDPGTVEESGTKRGYPVPWAPLDIATGGIAAGELWLVGARLGQGKSWLLPLYVDALASGGATCAVLTLEMPVRSYVRRFQRIRAGLDHRLQRDLRSSDKATRMAALEALPPLPGRIDVFDPSQLQGTVRSVRALAADYQFVAVDHMGLLRSSSGVRSVQDWRVAAEVSNELKEITLEQSVGVLAAAQVNREGDSNSYRPPKLSQIAGADDLGRDADYIVLMRRMGERTMLHDLSKSRDGRPLRWYTRFEPETADFSEITKDEALDRARMDGDRDV